MIRTPWQVLGLVLLLAGGVTICAGFWTSTVTIAPGRHAVPSLTAWGKIFSFLLLAALGVAYLVWRRPMVHARAILETSPLGTSPDVVTLVDWVLYCKVLLAVEALAMSGVVLLRLLAERPLTPTDTMGVIASASIVAFVLHLLMLTRRGGGGTSS